MKKLLFLVTAMALISLPGWAQVHGGPDLQWKHHDIASFVVDGPLINPVAGSGVVLGSAQTPDVSGEEWWYDITNCIEAGVQTGYIVSGYANWTNIDMKEGDIGGCTNLNQLAVGPDCSRPILDGKPMSQKLSTVAKYDLKGNMLWCKAHSVATEGAMSVAASSDGGYVFTGWGKVTRTRLGAPVYFNPDGVTFVDISAEGYCSELNTKMHVGKVDANGNLEWLHQFSHFDLGGGFPDAAVLGVEAIGYDIIQKPTSGGAPLEYRVVGHCQDLNNLATAGDYSTAYTKAFVLDVDEDGNKIDSWLYGDANSFASCRSIDVKNDNYYVTGLHIDNGTSLFVGVTDAVLFKINEAGTLLPLSIYPWSGTTAGIRYGSSGENAIGIDVKVLDNDLIAWALLDDCNGCRFSGNNIGTGRIFLVDEVNSSNNVYIDLAAVNTYGFSQVHAFDMKMGLINTQDGGFACVTTIQDSPIDAATRAAEPYASILDDLNNQISHDCLDGIDAAGNSEFEYGFWNTNAYVAKFDGNGNLIWDKSFDSDDNGPLPFPGDWKEQECVYRITEADDGSLVFVGNTSHNSDDYYIAKIGSDCALKKDIADEYDINYGTDPEKKYEIFTSQTWTPATFGSSTVSAVGTIIVKSGVTLTISGLTIEFADSRKMPFETKLIVERGAHLVLQNGTVLTSLSDCDNTMWNGVEVWGEVSQPQTTMHQGMLSMRSSTIENAIIGVSCVKRDNFTKDPEYTGGILRISDSKFLNNVIGVEIRPYQNQSGGVISDNVSVIRTSEFLIDGPLNDPEWGNLTVPDPQLPPGGRMTEKRAHQAFILLDGIRGVRILGNEFTLDQTFGSTIDKDNKGYGILAWDSEFKALTYSTIFQDPNPDRNVFNNLWGGIYCKSTGGLTDLEIDGSIFNNNHYGIAFDGADFGLVTNNQFNVPENGAAGFDVIEANTGVHARSATGFVIESNNFNGVAQSPDNENAGIYVENSSFEGSEAEIYNNSFDLFDISVQSSENNEFLWVDCNRFDNDVTANPSIAWHNESGEVGDQGFCFGVPEGPHSNRFVGTHTGPNYQIFNQGATFEYRNYSEPDMILTNEVNVDETNCVASFPGNAEACPARYVAPPFKIEEPPFGGRERERGESNNGDAPSDMREALQWLIADYLQENDFASAIAMLENMEQTEASLMLLPILLETRDAEKMRTHTTAIRAKANLDPDAPRSIEWLAICDFYELMLEMRTQEGGIEAASGSQIQALQMGGAQSTSIAVNYRNVLQYLGLMDMEELFIRPLDGGSQKSIADESQEDEMTKMAANKLSIFPNPATSEVRIQYEALLDAETATLQIVDISGRVVFTQEMNNDLNNITVDLTEYNSGLYLVQISQEDGTYEGRRLIISK